MSTYTMPRPAHRDDLHWQNVTGDARAMERLMRDLPSDARRALVMMAERRPNAIRADLMLLCAGEGL